MAACCNQSAPPPTKEEFLTQKLENFRAFLEPHCTTPDLQEKLKTYSSLKAVMPWLYQAAAVVRAGQIEAAVTKFCESFGNAGKTDAFRTRIRRTLQMFADVMISA